MGLFWINSWLSIDNKVFVTTPTVILCYDLTMKSDDMIDVTSGKSPTSLPGLRLEHVSDSLILPGEIVGTLIDVQSSGSSGKRAIVRVGSGVTQREDYLQAVKGGKLCTDMKRNKVWLFHNQRRYQAFVDDMIIGIVQEKHSEEYRLDINGVDTAVLGQLLFEGASKKNKPNLHIGSAVFCRVTHASKHTEPQVSCIEPGSVRSWAGGETLYGELKNGNIVHVSLALARALLKSNDEVLSHIGEKVPFQSAVGVNGRVWVQAGDLKQTVAVCDAIGKADVLERDQWLEYVDKLLRKM